MKYWRSSNRLLSTVAYRLSGKVSYAIEGSIFYGRSNHAMDQGWIEINRACS